MNRSEFFALWTLIWFLNSEQSWIAVLNGLICMFWFTIVAIEFSREQRAEREITRRVIDIEMEKANDRP